MKNFKLTTEKTINFLGITLFRIKATCSFKNIEKGEVGGWVEKEENISGDAWVSGNAWEKSPLQIQGSMHFVNVFNKSHLRIGCKEFSFSYWKENYREIGKDAGYTENEIKEYGLYIDLAISIYGNE